jgi:hypothetical protein
MVLPGPPLFGRVVLPLFGVFRQRRVLPSKSSLDEDHAQQSLAQTSETQTSEKLEQQ